jgi:hypothetical protein
MRRFISFVVLVASTTVGAKTTVAQSAEAEILFREGRRLMDEGNVPEACTAFEGSYRKGPAISTLLNLANCREKNHQYASAWGHFIEAARQTRGNPDQRDFHRTATERAAALEARLSYLIINVPNDVQVEGLAITRNGAPVDPAEWNRDIPVDGGEYKIEGKAPAYEAWSSTVKVGNAKDKQSVNVPRFQQAPTSSTRSGRSAAPSRRSSLTGSRKAAIAAWVVGTSAVGAGVLLELSGRSTYDEAKASTDPIGRVDLYDSANQKHTVAVIAGATGAALVSAGIFLWITGKPAERTAVAVTPHLSATGGGLAVRGAF